MTRSSRHKSHKQSKHSSRDYSDSEEDVKVERSSREDTSVRSYRDSASGEKRKVLSQLRESKDVKDLDEYGNGQVLDEYVSSKRRKEKADASVGGDRWNGGGEERVDGDRVVEKESSQRVSLKVESKSRDSSIKGESLRTESKSKSKRYESGGAGERKEEILTSSIVEKEDSRGKGESKRKSERDSSSRKEKELKDKERKLEKSGGHESKYGVDEAKLVDIDVGKKQVLPSVDMSEDRQGKRSRSNTDRVAEDDARNHELEKESEKRRRRREGSSERDRHRSDSKEANERRLSSRGDRAKETKYKDEKQKDGSYSDKHHDDSHKDVKQKDEKVREEADKDNKHWDERYREDGEKEARYKDDKREESNRDYRRKDDKHREDGDQDSRRKDDKYREGTERDHRDDKYHEDGDRDGRRKDDRYREDTDKDNRKDERYYEDADRDDRRRYESVREDVDRLKDGKYREDIERDIRHKDRKSADDYDREKRQRSSKYRDEYNSRDRTGDRYDLKGSRDDGYPADHHSRKSSAYDDSPSHDDRSSRYRDDQSRRKTNEKEDYGDVRSQNTKDQRSNVEKKSTTSARMDAVPERGRSTSRNVDIELTSSSHSRRRNSPGISSHDARDHFRVSKQDESKYRDVNYDDRGRHGTSSNREYAGAGGSEKTSPWSLEKLGQKGDGHLGELSGERRLKSDIRPSSLQMVDKSPSSTDKRQFSRSDVRRSTDHGDSTHRGSGFRDAHEYSGKEGRGSRDVHQDVLPGDDSAQGDGDSSSLPSPFIRNNQFSSSSKSLPPPPPFRTGVDSPLPLGASEDDSRGKPNSRHRRMVDPNMGRIQGAWRGIPSWPSPVANGPFLPYPHPPPPVRFMPPFPTPPMFGVGPSMDLNHSLPSPYHMPDADRFSGQVHPMGWRNQVDNSPFNAWDASNSGFGDESHNYGRPDWDPSRNHPGARGWETGGDMWKGNKTTSLEMPSSEKENNSTRSGDDALGGQSIKPAQSEQTQGEQQAESTGISQSSRSIEKNEIEALGLSMDDAVAKSPWKDDACHSHVYLSRLDISADLVEPEIFDKCTGFMDMDLNLLSDVDDSKILYMEEAVEAKATPHEILSYSLFQSAADSVFQKALALYKMNRDGTKPEVGEKVKVSSDPSSEQGDLNHEDQKTEKPSPLGDMQGVEEEDALPNFDIEVELPNHSPILDVEVDTSQQKPNLIADADVTEKSEEIDNAKQSETLPCEVKEVSEPHGMDTEEVETKSGPFLSKDVSSEIEAVMQESVMSNLSRIHHSPESTH